MQIQLGADPELATFQFADRAMLKPGPDEADFFPGLQIKWHVFVGQHVYPYPTLIGKGLVRDR